MFSLESPHRGDSNEFTQYTILNINKKKHPKLFQICSYGLFSKGLETEFETAVVNELSVYEPLKFYCTTVSSTYRLVIVSIHIVYLMLKTGSVHIQQDNLDVFSIPLSKTVKKNSV